IYPASASTPELLPLVAAALMKVHDSQPTQPRKARPSRKRTSPCTSPSLFKPATAAVEADSPGPCVTTKSDTITTETDRDIDTDTANIIDPKIDTDPSNSAEPSD
ncbi:hypothetical protein QBC32DRAFT_196324, partial [Pseudoneurospora amorphoporcata]